MTLEVKQLGLIDYASVWQQMKDYTLDRDKDSLDQLWLLQHPPVFTQGQAGKAHHLLNPGDIPVVQSDRGGQVTYHGPGQLVAYVMVDLKRLKIGIRSLVSALEKSLITLLKEFGLNASTQCGAPGVYIEQKKIASIGLRVKKGCSYHGISLNLDMDLSPFKRINPCGFDKLEMTQLKDYIETIDIDEITNRYIDCFKQQLYPQLCNY